MFYVNAQQDFTKVALIVRPSPAKVALIVRPSPTTVALIVRPSPTKVALIVRPSPTTVALMYAPLYNIPELSLYDLVQSILQVSQCRF